MTHAAIAADFHKALDIERYVTAQVALHLEVMLNVFAQLADFVLGEILYAGVRIDAGFGNNLLGSGQADAIDVGQAYFHALLSGQVNARNTCHVLVTPPNVFGWLSTFRPGGKDPGSVWILLMVPWGREVPLGSRPEQ